MTDSCRLGVVLSSGGARGVYAHTGFLLALEQLGVSICASAGCSAGAVVGGVAASGTSLDDWEQAIAQVSQGEFWTPDSLPRFPRARLPVPAVDPVGDSEYRAAVCAPGSP